MKLVFVFLACFVAVSLQRNVRWRSQQTSGGLPYYFGLNKNPYQQYPAFPYYQAPKNVPYFPRSPSEGGQTFPFNFIDLLNIPADFYNFLNILRPTITVQPTTLSTVHDTTLTTCYTSTMFAATNVCRRKRDFSDMLSVEGVHDESPTNHESLDSAIEQLPREGRDMDMASYVQSSRNEHLSGSPQFEIFTNLLHSLGTVTVNGTSTVTSFTTDLTIFGTTNTDLAPSGVIACVPSGIQVC